VGDRSKATLAFAIVVGCVILAYLVGTWAATLAPHEISRQEAVTKAIDAADSPGWMSTAGAPWNPTFVEKESGREIVVHYPGPQHQTRAPCMRPLNLSFLACSEAPVWYVHLEAGSGYYFTDVVVDARLGTAAIVGGGSGPKPLPPGVTPLPKAA